MTTLRNYLRSTHPGLIAANAFGLIAISCRAGPGPPPRKPVRFHSR